MTRRLIEHTFPLGPVSAEAGREKSLRRGHISTLHMWWARRPLVMARAITLALLLPEPEDDAREKDVVDFITEFANFDTSLDPRLQRRARDLIGEAFGGRAPRVLDPFSGGGALPLEALRIGADVDAVELNPVAYLLLLCTLDYPIRFKGRRAPEGLGDRTALSFWVERGAAELRRRVEAELADVYKTPDGRPQANAYLWARTLTCTNPVCQVDIPLMSSRWLDNNAGRRRAFNVVPTEREIGLVIAEGSAIQGDPDVGTVQRVTVACPKCGTTIDRATLRQIGTSVGYGERLIGVVEPGAGRLSYREPIAEDLISVERAEQRLASLEPIDGVSPYPDEDIPYSNLQVPYVYGFTNWTKYFNARQKVLLATLARDVHLVYADVLHAEGDEELAKGVATYLGLIINRIADRNSTFSSWTAGRQLIRNTFARQGISNVWDYTESSPFGGGSGSWDNAVEWVVRVIEHCERTADEPARVVQASVMRLPYEDDTFDAIITDPPYYDSVQYGDLSDFFYVWLKRSVGFLYPGQFATPQTPKSEEIVSKRLGRNRPGAVMADEYERRLSVAFKEMRRVVKPHGIAAVIFAHTATAAWEALIRTMIDGQWTVTTSWPVRSEFVARSRAHGQPSLASSVCLVCRPRALEEVGFFEDVRAALEDRVRTRLDEFWRAGISGADFFISAIGPAIEVFGRYKQVVRLSGEPVGVDDLLELTQQVVADFTLTHLLDQEAVGAIDEASRFYLFWRWAFGRAGVPADDAYKLAHAFGVELDRLTSGVALVRKSGDQVSVLGPRERESLLRHGAEVDRADPLIDVLHRSLLLWEAGRRSELAALLAGYQVDTDPAFWAVAQALSELLAEDDPERMMAQGITGARGPLSEGASQHRPSDQITMDLG
jgi:adenine-specific DNA methylase